MLFLIRPSKIMYSYEVAIANSRIMDRSILESPLSTADAMRDIQILYRKSPNGRFFISFQTHILTAKIK